jgi:hypothetical protein
VACSAWRAPSIRREGKSPRLVNQHRISTVGLLLAAALAFGAACRGGASQPTLTTLPSPETQATATIEPGPTDDSSLIEPIIAALRSGDPEAIRPHIGFGFAQVSCGNAPAQGSPVPNSCNNTPEPAFFYGTCEGEYLRPSEVQRALDVMAGMQLYAVYRVPPQFRSVGQYSVILTDRRADTAGQAWEAVIDNERIVALIYSCTLPPNRLIELRGYTDAVLPPQTP